MPKVGKLNTQIKGVKREHIIWYTEKDGFFLKDLPAEIYAFNHGLVFKAKTKGELEDGIGRLIHQYHEKTKSERKVIAYELELSPAMYSNPMPNGYSGIQNWLTHEQQMKIKKPGFGAASHVIGMSYEVLLEYTMGSIEYYTIGEDGKPGHSRTVHHKFIIDWTQEREDALKGITVAMHELAKKMGSIMLDPDKATAMLDSGRLKLSQNTLDF